MPSGQGSLARSRSSSRAMACCEADLQFADGCPRTDRVPPSPCLLLDRIGRACCLASRGSLGWSRSAQSQERRSRAGARQQVSLFVSSCVATVRFSFHVPPHFFGGGSVIGAMTVPICCEKNPSSFGSQAYSE